MFADHSSCAFPNAESISICQVFAPILDVWPRGSKFESVNLTGDLWRCEGALRETISAIRYYGPINPGRICARDDIGKDPKVIGRFEFEILKIELECVICVWKEVAARSLWGRQDEYNFYNGRWVFKLIDYNICSEKRPNCLHSLDAQCCVLLTPSKMDSRPISVGMKFG